MMNHYLFLFISVLIMCSCASSNKKNQQSGAKSSYPNLVKLEKPKKSAVKKGKVYIDSVKKVTKDSQKALLISGNFADGCTHLKSVTHRTKDDSLMLELSSWRDPEAMCTQALTPFSFIYEELSDTKLSNYSQVSIKDKTYSL